MLSNLVEGQTDTLPWDYYNTVWHKNLRVRIHQKFDMA